MSDFAHFEKGGLAAAAYPVLLATFCLGNSEMCKLNNSPSTSKQLNSSSNNISDRTSKQYKRRLTLLIECFLD